MQAQDRLSHQHGKHGSGRRTVFLHEAHERFGRQAETVFQHLPGRIGDDFRQVVSLGHLFPFRHGEIRGNLILPGAGIHGLRFRRPGAVGADAGRVVFLSVLHAVIMVQHRLQKRVDALAVAEAMEHGKPGPVSVPGQVQHMIIGFAAAHGTGTRITSRFHGQRVLRVIYGAVIDHKCIRQVRHPADRPLQSFLQKAAVDFLAMGHLHGVDGNIILQINIGRAGQSQFLFLKIRTFACHVDFSSLIPVNQTAQQVCRSFHSLRQYRKFAF